MSVLQDPVNVLLQRARAAARAAALADASRWYQQVLNLVPEHTEALSFLGQQALAAGELDTCADYAERALRSAPDRAVLWRNRARMHRAAGRPAQAAADLQRALELEADSALTVLELGTDHASTGDMESAVRAWQHAMRLEPRLTSAATAAGFPDPIPALALQARRGVREWLFDRQLAAITHTRQRYPQADLERVERSVRMAAGVEAPAYNASDQRPSFFLVPDLPATPFFERAETPWLGDVERSAPVVLDECLAVLDGTVALSPYVTRDPGGATDWSALVGADAWSSFHLYKDAQLQVSNAGRCPCTTALLEGLPVSRLHGVPKEAFFSVLGPGAHIPPHFGLSNAKAVVHLGLVIPPGCHLAAGGQRRGWKDGEAWVFDDSFEHEARNDAGTRRVVFIFEVWNPRLSSAEIDALTGVFDAFEDLMRL